MNDVFIYRVELPTKIKGNITILNGDYLIFINSLLKEETQFKALRHELAHYKLDHMYDELKDVLTCEREANSFA